MERDSRRESFIAWASVSRNPDLVLLLLARIQSPLMRDQ